MSTVEKGTKYENFVEKIMQAVNEASKMEEQHQLVKIEKNKKLEDKAGRKRQIDLYWEYEILGQVFKTAIECKDYESKISIDRIEAFATKIKNLGINKGVFATRKGFQQGAIDVAKHENISLILVRDVEDEDFKDRIRKINVSVNYAQRPRIDSFKPSFDVDWIEANTSIREGDGIRVDAMSDEIKIVDVDNNREFSFVDLSDEILPTEHVGPQVWKEKYSNAYFVTPNAKYKILAFEVKYTVLPTQNIAEWTHDFAPYVLGVIEYITEEKDKFLAIKK